MIPYFHATKLGTVWYDWKKHKEIGYLKITNNELFELNLLNFKVAMKELERNQVKKITLKNFLEDSK